MIVLETVEGEDWERLNALIAECLGEDLEAKSHTAPEST